MSHREIKKRKFELRKTNILKQARMSQKTLILLAQLIHVEEYRIIEELYKSRGKGARPSFSPVDVIRMIVIIGRKNLISRSALANELGIGEGAVRTLIKYLKSIGFIEVIRSGIRLKDEGKKFFKAFNDIIIFEEFLDKDILGKLALAEFNYVLVAKELGHKIKKGLEERDIAIRLGAKGLITLVFTKEEITFPDGYPLGNEYKVFKNFIKEKVKLKEKDLIIISCADNKSIAIDGAYAVLYFLLKL